MRTKLHQRGLPAEHVRPSVAGRPPTPQRRGAPAAISFLAGSCLLAFATSLGAQVADDPLPIDLLLDIRSQVGGETPRWSPDGERILFASGGELTTIDPAGGVPRRIPASLGGSGHFLASQSPRWSPDGRWISFISDRTGSPELWLWSVESGTPRRLTGLGGRLIGSYSWSPDGRRIALASDRHGNMDIWTVSVPDGRLTRLTSEDLYEVYPAWSPDSRNVLYVRLDETWANHDVLEVAVGGAAEPRLIVRDRDFFDYGGGSTFGYPRVSHDGEHVLIRSHRSGWINYWTVPRSGGEPRPVAAEEADQSHARWSPDGQRVAFVSNRNGTHVLRVVPVDGGEARTLVAPEGPGVVGDPEWSPDGRRISYTLETPTRPKDLHVVTVASGERHRLTRSLPEGVSEARLVAPEKVVYPSTDGLTVHAYLYRPPGDAPPEGHPAILWIHGGPTSQYNDTFQQHVQYFVQRGYVVLMPNIRGSSGYGKAFEDANNGCWGHCDLEDVRAGVEFLKGQPFVDGDAMGITGSSYGGIMTMAAVSFAPGLFQAAVSQSGYGDWVAFAEGSNELRHMKLLEYEFGPFAENRDVYRHNSAISGVADASTPIFLVHGEGRYPGSPQSHQFAAALQAHYKPFRYKTYPGETYYVASRENRRELLRDMEAYFDWYLKGTGDRLPGRDHVSEVVPGG